MTDVTDNPDATFTPLTHFKSFEESTAEDWAIIAPMLAHTQALVADKVIEQLRYLEHDHGGFPVNRLEHSLQTATRAERDGRDDEYIVCALLHDIGDNFAPYNHPDIGPWPCDLGAWSSCMHITHFFCYRRRLASFARMYDCTACPLAPPPADIASRTASPHR